MRRQPFDYSIWEIRTWHIAGYKDGLSYKQMSNVAGGMQAAVKYMEGVQLGKHQFTEEEFRNVFRDAVDGLLHWPAVGVLRDMIKSEHHKDKAYLSPWGVQVKGGYANGILGLNNSTELVTVDVDNFHVFEKSQGSKVLRG